MKRLALALALLIASVAAALAQNATVVGPITPGNIPQFNSPTVIKDSGNPGGAAAFANPTGAVGLTAVNGAANTAMRSDAAPPLSTSVQSALTSTVNQVLTGTGAFGFSSITNTQLTALINPFTSGLSGAVPASGGGTTNFLRADGAFAPAGGGAISNVRLAKTSAYTTVSGDCASTLALGGSAFFPATFNAPSGYTATCAFLVTNEDTAFGKLLIPQLATSATSFTVGTGSKAFTTTAGLPIQVPAPGSARRYRVYSLANPANFMSGAVTAYASTTLTILIDTVGGSGTFTDWQIAPEIRLWPGQTRMIYAQNNVWLLDDNTRWKLPAETEICVDANTGSDSNDGLGVGTRCFQHIQFATNVVYQDLDANNFPPDIGLYTGPFTEAVSMQGQITGYNFIRFRTRAANTWASTVSCVTVNDNAEAIFDASFGFTQKWTCNTNNTTSLGAIYGHQLMVTDIVGAHQWIPGGTNDNFVFMDGEGRGDISGSGAGIILGSGAQTGATFVTCNYHCAGVTIGGTISYGGAINITNLYIVKGGSVIDHSANPTGSPGTIGVTVVNGLSILRENGLTLPGGTTTANGGVVCATSC
jgi:hypothetical protein